MTAAIATPSTWVGGASVFDYESDGCECLGGEEIVHISGSGEEGAGKSGGCHGVSVDINLPGPIAINEDCGNQLLDVGKGKFVVEDFQGVIPGKGKDTVGHVNGLIDREGKYRKSIVCTWISTWVAAVDWHDTLGRKVSFDRRDSRICGFCSIKVIWPRNLPLSTNIHHRTNSNFRFRGVIQFFNDGKSPGYGIWRRW